jgi:serine/threonine protein kinase
VARKQLGKYDIIERLGRGGMAEVYKAYQGSLDRFVAIKLLHPFLADDPEFKDRFEREARNVARLRHPNIVQVYDFEYDVESESYYMVMELIDGQTLKDRLTAMGKELLPVSETLRIMREATEALAYAHARGMIHRDVKPANLMLDSDGRVVLTDFGIAKIVTGIQFTASGGMVGTPAYMAPEQGLGDAGDERSDLYSLGVILFQLVAGKLPYDADTPLAVILKHLNEPVPNVREFNPDVLPEIETILAKTMAKDPEDRYQNAEGMLRELYSAAGLKMSDSGTFNFTGEQGSLVGAAARKEDTAGSIMDTPNLATSTAVVPSRRTSLAGLGAIAVLAILALLLLTGQLRFPGGATPTATVGSTLPASATVVPVVAVANTPTIPVVIPTDTLTPSATLTSTDTVTPSLTLTPTDTLTPTPNITATILAGSVIAQNVTATVVQQTLDSFFLTQKAQTTPTVDLTGTAERCIKAYRQIVDKPPQQDPIKANTEFSRQVVLRNTSNCDWQPGMYLSYISGEQFNAPIKIDMQNQQAVKPGENATFIVAGHTPKKGGLDSGMWEVRLLGDVLVDPPLTISFFVYE